MGEERRIEVLEHEVRQSRDTAARMENKIDSIAETLRSLVRIEERQVAANLRLAAVEEEQKDHDGRIKTLEVALPENADKRLVSIETKMPGLVESRTWVVSGVLAGVGMLGLALIHIVLK